MLLNKIVIIGILLISIPNISGWDDETPLADNETMNHNWNPYINESTINTPQTIDNINDNALTLPFFIPTYISNDQVVISMAYTIYKQIWDGNAYIQDDNCFITVDESVILSYNSITNKYEVPNNWENIQSNGYITKKYFQDLVNSDNQYCNEINTTETDKPDIFKSSISIDVDDGSTYVGETYIQFTQGAVDSLTDGDIDAGYDAGKGKMGGSSSIYQGINLYGGIGDNQDMKGGFDNFFFMLIPLIFIIAVMRFAGRILK